jgi:uncharacterized protein YwgA
MKDYWLSKLIGSVPQVDSRKRLQKSIYLLQLAGCPLKCEYILHYYGPYSFELATLIDQLRGAQIIEEIEDFTGFGNVRYRSKITETGKRVLGNFEKTPTGKKVHRQIRPFISQFEQLSHEDPWVLELAATVAYCREDSWEDAKARAATFKRIRKDDPKLVQATGLAKEFMRGG